MNVAIVGAGALGALLASRLSRTPGEGVTEGAAPPADVQVLVRTAASAARLRFEAPAARVVGDPSDLRRAALLFICVKSYQTESAIETLDTALDSTGAAVVSLQNGWGAMDRLTQAFPAAALVAGATTLGAHWDDEGVFRTSLAGGTTFAPWNAAGRAPCDAAVALFRAASLRAERAENARDMLWRKLVLNAAVNPVTAVHGVRNGALLTSPALHALALDAAREAVAVGAARGHLVAPYDPEARLDALLRDTAGNRSSMAEDLAHGRRTEADAIVGAIVAEGAAAHVPTPVLVTLAERLRELAPAR